MLKRPTVHCQRRLYSELGSKISQKAASNSDISNDLRGIPTFTGSGPFIEHPTFEPLGPSSSLLNLKLPASSILNLRANSILAANGELGNISSKLKVINLWTKPLLYNEISSTSPISLVISNSNRSFVNLEVTNEPWFVLNSNDLEGWYGDFTITPSLKLPGVKLETQGQNTYKKNLILSGEGQLFNVKLDEGEDIMLNLSSVVGFSGVKGSIVKRDIGAIGIPKLGIIDTIKTQYEALSKIINPGSRDSVEEAPVAMVKEVQKEERALIESREHNWTDTAKDWLSTKINNIKYKNKLYYQIQGPATIIIQNKTTPISKTFTSEQLQTIYKQLK